MGKAPRRLRKLSFSFIPVSEVHRRFERINVHFLWLFRILPLITENSQLPLNENRKQAKGIDVKPTTDETTAKITKPVYC